jgi:putative nucleotidyltransferase with HDIG domain
LIQHVNDALVELQSTLLARSLYPPDHPRVRNGERSVLERLRRLLAQRDEISLFAVDGRVVFDNEILPSCASLADTLFRMLQVYGVDRITFRRGVDADELAALVAALSDGGRAGYESLTPSAHIRFGALHAGRSDEPLGELPRSSAVAYAEEAADVLPGIWQSVRVASNGDEEATGGVDTARLGAIVAGISKVVKDTASAMLPLAPLKRHDEYTFVHTVNVAILSTSLAEALGYPTRVVHDVNVSALLHDVGKQAVPTEVLNKKARFTDEERRAMQLHPIVGARMLLNAPGVPDLAVVVAYEHHVRADGSGYPRVPPGWKLNMASRIVQLADVFDALRTNRPYRLGLPVPKIVEMMRNDVGSFFDGDLLDVFFQRVVSRGIPESATLPPEDPPGEEHTPQDAPTPE